MLNDVGYNKHSLGKQIGIVSIIVQNVSDF